MTIEEKLKMLKSLPQSKARDIRIGIIEELIKIGKQPIQVTPVFMSKDDFDYLLSMSNVEKRNS